MQRSLYMATAVMLTWLAVELVRITLFADLVAGPGWPLRLGTYYGAIALGGLAGNSLFDRRQSGRRSRGNGLARFGYLLLSVLATDAVGNVIRLGLYRLARQAVANQTTAFMIFTVASLAAWLLLLFASVWLGDQLYQRHRPVAPPNMPDTV